MSSNISLRLLSSGFRKSSSVPHSRWLTRGLHERRGLLYPLDQGLGKFLPPPALKTALEWQEGLLQRLNEEVKGTTDENASVTQTIINTSGNRERTLAFNYASLALNNSYFLDQLKPPPTDAETHEREISPNLLGAIENQYGSLRQLKSHVSAAALGMFSNGWVWFVTDEKGNTAVLPTFGPGTILIRSRTYMAADKGLVLGDWYLSDSNFPPPSSPISKTQPPGTGPSSPASGTAAPNIPRPTRLGPRFLHTTLARENAPFSWMAAAGKATLHGDNPPDTTVPDILNVGQTLYPLFCIPVYEHSWMSAGFGIWGKEDWLKEFWGVVDWAKVTKSYNIARSKSAF